MIVFISLLGFSLGKRENLSWPEKIVTDTFAFAQNIFYKPAGFIAGLFEDIGNLKNIYKENEELKIAVAHYTRDKANYNFIAAENERLQKALKFTEAQKLLYKYDYKIAQVVSVNQDPYNYTVTINLGTKNGVKVGQVVTSVDGMVGTISRVSEVSSTVQLLTALDEQNPNSNAIAVTAMGKENKTFGLLSSYNAQDGTYLMTKIDENDPIAKDDKVVTSGIGEAFPRGMLIGTVISTQVGDFGLTHTATIKPAVNFDDWKELFVVMPQQ